MQSRHIIIIICMKHISNYSNERQYELTAYCLKRSNMLSFTFLVIYCTRRVLSSLTQRRIAE
jgi:hypothetical protein